MTCFQRLWKLVRRPMATYKAAPYVDMQFEKKILLQNWLFLESAKHAPLRDNGFGLRTALLHIYMFYDTKGLCTKLY